MSDEYEVAVIDNQVDRIDTATMLHNIQAQGEVFEAMQAYVKSHMIEGQDYGKIPGCAKPSLWKPGAEKIDFMFNLVPKYEILSETESNTEYTYKIRCDLYNKNNMKFMGSGLGYASTREKKFSSAPANTILKMSKKRSYIDATLSSTMASFIFTQDIIEEDDNKEEAQKNFSQINPVGNNVQVYDRSKENPDDKPKEKINEKTGKKFIPKVSRLYVIGTKDHGLTAEEFKVLCWKTTGKEHSKDYTNKDCWDIEDALNALKKDDLDVQDASALKAFFDKEMQ